MMKQLLPLLLIALLIPVAAMAVPDVQLQRHDPTPAQPGDLLSVQLALTNPTDTAMRNVELEILESNTVRAEGRNTLRAATIGAYSSFQGTLQVRVAADAPSGEATLRTRVRIHNGQWQERTQTITVQTSQAGILVSNVQVTPEAISPGRSATVELTVQNNANSLLREVSTQLQLEETPFVPTQTTTRQRVGDLPINQQRTITYELTAQPEAQAGIYQVPITLRFQDRNGNVVEQQDMIGLSVTTQQVTTANVDNVQRVDKGVEVSVRIVNKGLSEIKFVEASVQEQESVSIAAQERNTYLGNIASDDWQTMRFVIRSDKEQVEIPLRYTFQDAFNEEHTRETTLVINIPEEPRRGAGTGILLLILLAGGGYWVYRRKHKK
ncbi:MAG: COG1361 S-layer family protein [Candidatus Woesearchaeota archaeon]